MKEISSSNLNNKNILVRVDFNVPVVNGIITDLSRIEVIKKTIINLQKKNNKIFLISHFGRPKGKKINFFL